MTKTYSQIVKQIEALKGEAEKARRKEIDGVIGRIREAIDVYALTAEDLGLAGKPKAPGKAAKSSKPSVGRKPKALKTARPAKYTDGAGGSWGGRGKRPQWLRDALASGKTLEDFAVK